MYGAPDTPVTKELDLRCISAAAVRVTEGTQDTI